MRSKAPGYYRLVGVQDGTAEGRGSRDRVLTRLQRSISERCLAIGVRVREPALWISAVDGE